jgi:tRNA dimethylallyltransferase
MIVAIVGPTGVGKTKLSIELAKRYNAIIINADSMQIYKGLDIGTAKITPEEKEGIKHYLFDIKDVTEDYSVYDYQADARTLIEQNKDKNIIFVGGTGLYLKAALYDYRFATEEEKKDYSKYTDEELYQMVLEKNPNTLIHPNNRVRLERYLNKVLIEIPEPIKLYDHELIGLTTNRDNLYEIINNRVDKMINEGLIEEAKSLYNYKNTRALKTAIGYKELFEYFDNKITYKEAVEKIKQNSRRYAKRQYTFFNNQFDKITWYDIEEKTFDEILSKITEQNQ